MLQALRCLSWLDRGQQCLGALDQAKDVLARDLAFAAFPGMELASYQPLECFGMATMEVEQRNKFDRQVIAALDQVQVLRQPRQPRPWRAVELALQLVQFEQHTRVAGVQREGPLVLGQRPFRVAALVIVGQAQVPVGGGEVWIQRLGLFPASDSLGVASMGIPEVAQVVGRARVSRIGAHGLLQRRHALQLVRETAVRRQGRGLPESRLRAVLVTLLPADVTQKIGQHRVARGRRLKHSRRFVEQARLAVVQGDLREGIAVTTDQSGELVIGRQQAALPERAEVQPVLLQCQHGFPQRRVGPAPPPQ